jgi:teichuronic acid biosynthesis glycosyltransferase TuaC
MRVLTFTSLFPNPEQPNLGVFVYQRMAAFAARLGNAVDVIAPVPYFPPWMPGAELRKFGRIPRVNHIGPFMVYHPRYPLLPKVSMAIHARLMVMGCARLVRKLHEGNPYSCLDAHYVYPDGRAAVVIGKSLGLPVVVSARGSDINLFPNFRLVRPQIRKTLREAAGRIAVSEALRKEMLEVAGKALEVKVIGNGIDPQRFFPVEQQSARKELSLPAAERIVLSVAALSPVKGHDLLIRAFHELCKTQPNLLLCFAGEGPSRSNLEALAESLGLKGRVRFAGACPNERLRYWYSAADVSCLASSREGWPNVVLESLACGTPVVATRVWGTPEALRSPDLGILVDCTEDSIAAGLKTALAQSWDRSRLAAHARGRSWDVVAGEVEDYFREILERYAVRSS